MIDCFYGMVKKIEQIRKCLNALMVFMMRIKETNDDVFTHEEVSYKGGFEGGGYNFSITYKRR